MIKLVYCLRKRADVSAGDFHRYWLETHGPLVRGFAAAIKARKYIQSHTILPEINALFVESRGLAAPYDGITEVWWDDEAALQAGMASPEGQEAHRRLKEDEATFIDFTASRVFMTREHLIFDL
ncbi:MAG: EthD domain-containing protein [Gammaproteobacteria bacterium]|nr:EthD domain-containing protein [Gammaproteobacteria bacterium]